MILIRVLRIIAVCITNVRRGRLKVWQQFAKLPSESLCGFDPHPLRQNIMKTLVLLIVILCGVTTQAQEVDYTLIDIIAVENNLCGYVKDKPQIDELKARVEAQEKESAVLQAILNRREEALKKLRERVASMVAESEKQDEIIMILTLRRKEQRALMVELAKSILSAKP